MNPEPDPKRARTDRWLKLVSTEGGVFVVHEAGARLCGLLIDILEEDNDDERTVPAMIANNEQLVHAADFLNYHAAAPTCPIIKPLRSNIEKDLMHYWDQQWLKREDGTYDLSTLVAMQALAMYLRCDCMADVCSIKLSCFTGRKTSEEVRECAGLPPMTVEEEHKIRQNNQWIFKHEILSNARSSPAVSLPEDHTNT